MTLVTRFPMGLGKNVEPAVEQKDGKQYRARPPNGLPDCGKSRTSPTKSNGKSQHPPVIRCCFRRQGESSNLSAQLTQPCRQLPLNPVCPVTKRVVRDRRRQTDLLPYSPGRVSFVQRSSRNFIAQRVHRLPKASMLIRHEIPLLGKAGQGPASNIVMSPQSGRSPAPPIQKPR
jgi:hypothetical protein